ncbi:MAG: cytochrome P450 [Pseudomonadota bacterium]
MASLALSDLVYDPRDAAIRADPFPLFRHLQDMDPLHWSPALKSWVLTRYDDVRRIALADDLSPDRLTPFYARLDDPQRAVLADVMRYLNLWLVFRDPPEHTRLRRLLGVAFTPRAVAALAGPIETIANELLDGLAGRGIVDLIGDFAMPLPALVIMDMLGVPRDRLDDMKAWSDDLVGFIGSARAAPDKYERARHGAVCMAACFRDLIAERRRRPRDDFMSVLIAARDDEAEDGSERLSEDELVASCMLFLFAGHETTTNLIGNAALMLMRNPDQRDRLLAEPALIGSAVEEFLRYDGPSNALARVVSQAHTLHGTDLKPGERVFAMLNAANRDARAFEQPDRLDIKRSPNRHMTFGLGIHFCLGAALARSEGRIAIKALVQRFPSMRPVDGDEPEWRDALIMRGMRRLPVVPA